MEKEPKIYPAGESGGEPVKRAKETAEKPAIESSPEGGKAFRAEAEQKESPREKLEKIRGEFQETRKRIEEATEAERAPFKAFAPYFAGHNRIELPKEKQEELEKQITGFKKQNKFAGPRILTGNKTAAEYDNKSVNFSTQTDIVELPSGEKVFIVDSYPASRLHRIGDAILKRLNGIKSYKVPNSVWKETFEKRSNIPTIRIENKNAVAMPYIENVNLGDLIARNKEIKDWGAVEWAGKAGLEKKKEIIGKAARAMEDVHRQNTTWGEGILGNMIIDKDEKVWICDPETVFNEDVPKVEQKAADLKDIIFTAAASLSYSEKFDNYKEVAKLVLDGYSDKSVVEAVKSAAAQKPGILQRLFFIYTQNRYAPLKDFKQHEEIRQAIAEYKAN